MGLKRRVNPAKRSNKREGDANYRNKSVQAALFSHNQIYGNEHFRFVDYVFWQRKAYWTF